MKKCLSWIIVAFAHAITYPLGFRRRLKILLLAQARLVPKVVSAKVKGEETLRFTTTTQFFARIRRYEPDTIAWIDDFPDSPVTFWDIGANVGAYSLYAALRPNVRVLAFEPAAASCRTLNENIEVNGMDGSVSAYSIAFGAKTEINTLNMSSTESGSSGNGFGVEFTQFEFAIDPIFRQGAVGFSMDDFVRLFSPPLPTHLKIDVDGLEPDILRGGRNTLSAPGVRSLIVEVEGSGRRRQELVELMGELGFVPRPKGSPDFRNIVFDRPQGS